LAPAKIGEPRKHLMKPDSEPSMTVQLPVLAVNASENSKTGVCSATYVSGKTCPDSCPFKKNGCYGEVGHVGIVARRVSRSGVEDGYTIGKMEAAAIDCLSAQLDLRLHVYGEFANASHASEVDAAAGRFKSRAATIGKKVKVWTYTHRWREIEAETFTNISALASVETLDDALLAFEAGYAPAISMTEFKSERTWTETSEHSFRILPCPAQTKGRKCVDCRMCFDSEALIEKRIAIGFRPNKSIASKKKFTRSLEVLNS